MTGNRETQSMQPFWMEIRARHIFTIVVLLAYVLLLNAVRGSLGPYILGIVLSYFLLPVVRRIESLIPDRGHFSRLRRPAGVLVSLALLCAAIAVLVTFLANRVIDEVGSISTDLPDYWDDLTQGERFGAWFEEHVPEDIRVWIESNISDFGQQLSGAVTMTIGFFFNITGSIVGVVIGVIIVPIFMVYFLLDRPEMSHRVRTMLPEAWVDDALQVLRVSDRIMAAYTRGVLLSSVAVGVITGLGYWLIGVELWVGLGVIAFLGEIVPILGPWIAFFISFPIILVTQPDKALLALGIFGVIQALEGWFITPKIEEQAIHLPAWMILLSLAVGGAVAGGIGIVLALPAAAIGRAMIVYSMRRLDGVRPELAAAGLVPDSPSRAAPGNEPDA